MKLKDLLGGTSSSSPVGLGIAQLGNMNRSISDRKAQCTVDSAWDLGIRYFDTAPHYGLGLAEARLGRALTGRRRDDFVISTKVGRLLVPSKNRDGDLNDQGFVVPADSRRVWDFSRDGVLRSIESSLHRLCLDRLDIVLLHNPDDHWSTASTAGINTLIELREQGVIHSVGVGMNHAAMPAEFIRRADINVVMVAGRYTLLDQSALDELLPLAVEHGVDIINAGVYNSGLLGRRRPDPATHFDYAPASGEFVQRATIIADVCEAHGVTLPDVAIAFAHEHPAVSAVVLGARSSDQVLENMRRFTASVPEDLWQELRALGIIPSMPTSPSGAP